MLKKLLHHLAGTSGFVPEEAEPLTVGGVPLLWSQETLHLLLAGSTGTGKTTAVAELLDGITARGDRAVIVDPNGAYASMFFEPGDVILNPYDRRSPGWSPFSEVRRPYDFDKVSKSIVPDGHGPDAAWHFYAQTLVAEVLRALMREGKTSTAELVQALTVWPAENLAKLVAGTSAAGLFDKDAARALASTRFVVASHLKPYDALQPGAFSVRNWVEADDDASRHLFITWREDMTSSLAPLIACWVDIACTAILSLPPDPARRLWLLLDELPSIGKVGSLEACLTKGRKHGLCAVAGVQSTAQLERLYGRESAVVLRSCFRNFAAFGLAKADPDTCETFSRALGEREVDRAVQSKTRGASGASQSVTVQRVRERVVMPSELAELPDLTAFLCLAGAEPARLVTLKPRTRPVVAEAITE
jgi:type IV secretory pathway TraG/TraD family ATPase VirD4